MGVALPFPIGGALPSRQITTPQMMFTFRLSITDSSSGRKLKAGTVAISNSSGLLSFKVSSLLVMGVTYLVSG
jgi:hypothetical protein